MRSQGEGRPPRKFLYSILSIRKSKSFGIRHSFAFPPLPLRRGNAQKNLVKIKKAGTCSTVE